MKAYTTKALMVHLVGILSLTDLFARVFHLMIACDFNKT